MKTLAWILFLSALGALAMTLAGCVLDDAFINPAMQQAQIGHLQNMAAAQAAPTPTFSELAKLKSANYQAPAPR